MTKYLKSEPFSVIPGSRDPDKCGHGWLDAKGKCVMCGEEQRAKDAFMEELSKTNLNRDWNAALMNTYCEEGE